MWKRAKGAPRTPFLGSRQEMYDEASRSVCINPGVLGAWCSLHRREAGRVSKVVWVSTRMDIILLPLFSPQILKWFKRRDHEKQPVKRNCSKSEVPLIMTGGNKIFIAHVGKVLGVNFQENPSNETRDTAGKARYSTSKVPLITDSNKTCGICSA